MERIKLILIRTQEIVLEELARKTSWRFLYKIVEAIHTAKLSPTAARLSPDACERALRRLEKEGLVRVRRRDERGISRLEYQITEAGTSLRDFIKSQRGEHVP